MNKITHLTWDDMRARVQLVDKLHERIYGVPRGGMIAASLLKNATMVHDPEEATLIIDDIIDSGRTHDEYRKRFPRTPFVGLIDRRPGPGEAFIETEVDRMGWVVFPWEADANTSIEDSVVRLLQFIGEDPTRDGLRDTPARVTRALKEMTRGYDEDPEKILSTTFDVQHDEMIVLRGIRFTSLCEHHMLPFVGQASVGYIPGPRVAGLSKLARLVLCFARRLQIQERMTQQIAEAMEKHLQPKGVAVVIKAHHACMGCRGVEQPETEMVTSSMLGSMRNDAAVRHEFLELTK